jgi:hypothetical protein
MSNDTDTTQTRDDPERAKWEQWAKVSLRVNAEMYPIAEYVLNELGIEGMAMFAGQAMRIADYTKKMFTPEGLGYYDEGGFRL